MKKYLSVIIVLVLLMTLIPVNAFAAAPQDLDLKVRNQTGVPVEMRLTGADGVPLFVTLPAGSSTLTLTEGVYEYYAVLPCGVASGSWNVNVVKILYLSCAHDMANSLLVKSLYECEFMGSWDGDFQDYLDGFLGVEEPDFYIGRDSAVYGILCLDPYLDAFYSLPGWEMRDINGDVIDSDPDFY